MRIVAISVVSACVALQVWPASAQTGPVTPKTQIPQEARALSRAFAATSRALRPSVVRIDVEQQSPEVAQKGRAPKGGGPQIPPDLERFIERFFGGEEGFPPPGPGRGTGSGLVIDPRGHLMTNAHVVENATKVTVTFADRREFEAQVVGHDPETDVAVLKLLNPPKDLIAARLGDSNRLEIGEWVLAIGSPLGLEQSVTAGIVSGKGKVTHNVRMSGRRMREYIQTDAKINPGNSGGPLVNLEGEVIGMNTQINMGPGGAYGFAIPINQARRIAQTLIDTGRVRHAWLGIGIRDVKDGIRIGDGRPGEGGAVKGTGPERAAWVNQVLKGSPAAKAGVHVGDVITQIDNQPIEAANDVVDYVASRPVGSKVSLAYLRDGKRGTVQITLEDLPPKLGEEPPPQEPKPDRLGLSLQTLTPELAGPLGLDARAKGALVTEVIPGSRAARAGLRPHDLLLEIDGAAVATSDEAIRALRAAGDKGLLVKVRRGTATQAIPIPAR